MQQAGEERALGLVQRRLAARRRLLRRGRGRRFRFRLRLAFAFGHQLLPRDRRRLPDAAQLGQIQFDARPFALLFLRQKCVDFFAEHGQHDFRRLGGDSGCLKPYFSRISASTARSSSPSSLLRPRVPWYFSHVHCPCTQR